MGNGVLYLATTKEDYIVQAYLSACSIKRYREDLPVVIFTDQPNHPLLKFSVFDIVNEVHIEHRFRDKNGWVTGKFPRIDALLKSPFARTFHLDCDTVVESNEFDRIFSILDQHDIALAECKPDQSLSRRAYGKRLFNTGVIGYKSCEKCKKLFEEWKELTLRHFRLIGNGRHSIPSYLDHVTDDRLANGLLRMDQLSLAQLFSPDVNRFNLKYALLHEVWNTRGSEIVGSTIINHLSVNRTNFVERLISRGAELDAIGDHYQSGVVYNYARSLMKSVYGLDNRALIKNLLQSCDENLPTKCTEHLLNKASLHNYFGHNSIRDAILTVEN